MNIKWADQKTLGAVIIAVIAIIIGFNVYQSNKQQAVSPSPSPVVQSSTTTYEGNLPCADCPGITETLTITKTTPEATGGAYTMKDVYQDKPNGTFETTGNWSTSKGIPADPNAQVLQLTPSDNSQNQYYLMDGTTLKPLDQQKNLIQSPFDQSLKLKS